MKDYRITNPRPMPEEIRTWNRLAYVTREERHEIMGLEMSDRAFVMERLRKEVESRKGVRK